MARTDETSSEETPACSGACTCRKSGAGGMATGAALLGLALGALAGCGDVPPPPWDVPPPPWEQVSQPLYGVAMDVDDPRDDDDSASGDDDDDSASGDDDDSAQP